MYNNSSAEVKHNNRIYSSLSRVESEPMLKTKALLSEIAQKSLQTAEVRLEVVRIRAGVNEKYGNSDFLIGNDCLLDFRQFDKQPILAVGRWSPFHRLVGTKFFFGSTVLFFARRLSEGRAYGEIHLKITEGS